MREGTFEVGRVIEEWLKEAVVLIKGPRYPGILHLRMGKSLQIPHGALVDSRSSGASGSGHKTPGGQFRHHQGKEPPGFFSPVMRHKVTESWFSSKVLFRNPDTVDPFRKTVIRIREDPHRFTKIGKTGGSLTQRYDLWAFSLHSDPQKSSTT